MKSFRFIFIGFGLVSWLFLAACSGKSNKGDLGTYETLTDANVTELLTKFGQENPETKVTISTSLGVIKVRLYKDTPLHRANFVRLAKMGFYDNTIFYRVLRDFMIQGGDTRERKIKTDKYGVPSEVKPQYFHKRGALAMARYDDEFNPKRLSSSHNFYLIQGVVHNQESLDDIAQSKKITFSPEQVKTYTTIGGVPSLDTKYTVFGEVTEGLDVIDKIAKVPVDPNDVPVQDVFMTVEVEE
ncbi:peptidylprolyl isomerase [Adhaeribacter pallidiroseus]|uniref:peptidylprolyl isomerase n=1 Tax=Adhaeribacter pallidiroseus TaxID=2072847 RepID=A0A369QJD2_9BACT|nr:peptidylprolyl isomerase [Adhaeribacter pallidiroseus]RDC64502.1 Peptidylprolyl isomerase [Adhaeribacter pallidiroseus]